MLCCHENGSRISFFSASEIAAESESNYPTKSHHQTCWYGSYIRQQQQPCSGGQHPISVVVYPHGGGQSSDQAGSGKGTRQTHIYAQMCWIRLNLLHTSQKTTRTYYKWTGVSRNLARVQEGGNLHFGILPILQKCNDVDSHIV